MSQHVCPLDRGAIHGLAASRRVSFSAPRYSSPTFDASAPTTIPFAAQLSGNCPWWRLVVSSTWTNTNEGAAHHSLHYRSSTNIESAPPAARETSGRTTGLHQPSALAISEPPPPSSSKPRSRAARSEKREQKKSLPDLEMTHLIPEASLVLHHCKLLSSLRVRPIFQPNQCHATICFP